MLLLDKFIKLLHNNKSLIITSVVKIITFMFEVKCYYVTGSIIPVAKSLFILKKL